MPDHLPYVVELMTLADVDQVMEIEQVAFPAPWSARAYRYEITENQHSTMLVVRPARGTSSTWRQLAQRLRLFRPGPVLGYGGFWLLVDEAHIATIAVDPQWRGRGLGELLLLSLLDRGAEVGASRATLEVRVSNHPAQSLYRKLGFEIVSRRKRYYADNDEDAFIMATPSLASPDFQVNLHRCQAALYTKLAADGSAHNRQNAWT
jgi:ribosomal-protein-alanine N-acetyltransferase